MGGDDADAGKIHGHAFLERPVEGTAGGGAAFPPIGISENVDSADSGSAGGNGNVRWDATVEREVGWGQDALEFRVKLASVLARKLR
jgi:hypothetical protein